MLPNTHTAAKTHLAHHPFNQVSQLFGSSAFIEMAFLTNDSSMIKKIEEKTDTELTKAELTQHLHEHLNTYFDRSLPQQNQEAQYTESHKRLLITHYPKWGIKTNTNLNTEETNPRLGKLGEMDTGPIEIVYDYLTLKEQSHLKQTNRDYRDITGKIDLNTEEAIAKKQALMTELNQAIQLLEAKNNTFMSRFGLQSFYAISLALFAVGVYTAIYTNNHTIVRKCKYHDDDDHSGLRRRALASAGGSGGTNCNKYTKNGGVALGGSIVSFTIFGAAVLTFILEKCCGLSDERIPENGLLNTLRDQPSLLWTATWDEDIESSMNARGKRKQLIEAMKEKKTTLLTEISELGKKSYKKEPDRHINALDSTKHNGEIETRAEKFFTSTTKRNYLNIFTTSQREAAEGYQELSDGEQQTKATGPERV